MSDVAGIDEFITFAYVIGDPLSVALDHAAGGVPG
jgi:hypothetical protein